MQHRYMMHVVFKTLGRLDLRILQFAGEGLEKLGYVRKLQSLSSEGSISCLTYSDTDLGLRSHPNDPQLSLQMPSIQCRKSCYLR